MGDEMKADWGSVKTYFLVKHKMATTIICLGILLVCVAAYISDCGSNWSFNRGVTKQKQAIANDIEAIKQANADIANLEQKKAAAEANVNNAVREYQNATYGLDNAKAETNQALANLNKAIKSNSNIDASADDVLKQLDKLKEMDQ